MVPVAQAYIKTVSQDIRKLPESLKFSDVHEKVRKLVVLFLPLDSQVTKILKSASAFYAPLTIGITTQGFLEKIKNFREDSQDLSKKIEAFQKGCLVALQSTEFVINLNTLNLLKIEKIVNFVKTIDVFQVSDKFNLEESAVLKKLGTFKSFCVLGSTLASFSKNHDYKNKTGIDEGKLVSLVADVFKLSVVTLSLASSLTSFGNLSYTTRFVTITPQKITDGLSYFSAAAALVKAVHAAK